MSAEEISIEDFYRSYLESASERGAQLLSAAGIFAQGRKPIEDRELAPLVSADLAKQYIRLRSPTWTGAGDALESERTTFLRIIACYANGMTSICATMPPPQEDRRRKVRQLAGALQRLQEVLTSIDSGALAQTLHEIDKDMHDGKLRAATDPVAAFLLAAALREDAGTPLSTMIVATQRAAGLLDEPDYDPILQTIWHMERLFDDHGLLFEAKDTGFAAECFRAIYEHANPGKSVERPKYLLNKAINDPRSWANFKKGIRKNHP